MNACGADHIADRGGRPVVMPSQTQRERQSKTVDKAAWSWGRTAQTGCGAAQSSRERDDRAAHIALAPSIIETLTRRNFITLSALGTYFTKQYTHTYKNKNSL